MLGFKGVRGVFAEILGAVVIFTRSFCLFGELVGDIDPELGGVMGGLITGGAGGGVSLGGIGGMIVCGVGLVGLGGILLGKNGFG